MSATTNTNSPYCQYCFDQPYKKENQYYLGEFCNKRCEERFREEQEEYKKEKFRGHSFTENKA